MSPLSSGSSTFHGHSRFPESCRNPFSSPHDSLRSKSTYRGPPAVFGPPRLWARDQMNRLQHSSEELDLRGIVDLNAAGAFGGLSGGVPYLSWEARRRRQVFFYLICALCVFPFIAPLVHRGAFNSALSWSTKGETCTLSRGQRRTVLVLGSVFSAIWLTALAVTVTLLASRNKNGSS
jgi:hypothetical protein